MTQMRASKIAVVIPCYKVRRHILEVVAGIGQEVDIIVAVDDACPQKSGEYLQKNIEDSRIFIVFHEKNQGVGAAVLTGYREAAKLGADVIIKIDGDGQMDPALIGSFAHPILAGQADYTKGNRFWDLREIRSMPIIRRIGNLGLGFMSKLATGYWDVFDPTNGYTGIHTRIAEHIPFESVSRRYFFESDMLFRLNVIRAVVMDIPMHSKYADEASNLRVARVLPEFAWKNFRNFLKRIVYNYYLRDLSLASFELLLGLLLLLFGFIWGGVHWLDSFRSGSASPVGTIMIGTVSLITGMQFLLAFVAYDIANVPKRPLYRLLQRKTPDGRLNTASINNGVAPEEEEDKT